VVYGALRTAYFSGKLEELEKAGGTEDPTYKLRVNRLFLTHDGQIYLPCPYDVVRSKAANLSNREQKKIGVLELQEATFTSSYTPQYILETADISQPLASLGGDHFLEAIDFEDYLNGETTITTRKQDYFYVREPKIGIQKSRKTGSSEEGKLYRVEMFRPKCKTGIFVEWQSQGPGFTLPGSGFLKIGGEGKSVSYIQHSENTIIEMPELSGNRLKVVFATPAVFENGWLPKNIDPRSLEGSWQGYRVKVLAAAFDRPIYLGGFRMKTKYQKGGPKSMRKAVPAGAVYYLEIQEGDVNKVAKAFHGQCLSEFGMDKEGYGLSFVGKVK
jgi:CRISPR-associated protein Cmr3